MVSFDRQFYHHVVLVGSPNFFVLRFSLAITEMKWVWTHGLQTSLGKTFTTWKKCSCLMEEIDLGQVWWASVDLDGALVLHRDPALVLYVKREPKKCTNTWLSFIK